MNIPMKYEDVVARLDAALGREAELCKWQAEQSDKMAALREELEHEKSNLRAFTHLAAVRLEMYETSQQRLTVAEQRSSELESAAREMLRIAAIANQGSKAYNRAIINLHSSLNPATEQVGLGSGKPVPPSKPVAPPIRRVVNDLVINKSEIEAHTTRNWRS